MRFLLSILLFLPLLGQDVCVSVPETLKYSLKIRGKSIGKTTMIVDTTTFEEKSVYNLIALTDMVKQGRNIRDSVILFFGKDWKPIFLERHINGAQLSLTVWYKDGKANVELKLGKQKKNLSISYPEGAVDNEEVLLFLSCTDLEKLGSGELVDITPLGGQTVKIRWKFEGWESLKGKKVKKVYMEMPLKKVEVFIRNGRILKYLDKSSGLEMILEE